LTTRFAILSSRGIAPIGAAFVIAAALAVALTVAAAMDDRLPGELRTVREIQGWGFPGDDLSRGIRRLTTTGLIIVLGVTLAVGLFVGGRRQDALALLLLMAALPLLQAGLKDLLDRPRPAPEEVEVRGDITSESFPAGHVMSPTVLYGYVIYLALVVRGWSGLLVPAAALCAGVLALTGLVNLWMGVHWPADVIGGYLWGVALLLAGIWFARRGPRLFDR
jgi:undecaprenyl-diphosphatase